MPVFYLNKSIGQTPKELVEHYKNKNNNINKISYCGRLDPMASGLMLILTNEDCKLQNMYLNLSKTYRFKLIVGIDTDSHDPLNSNINLYNEAIQIEILKNLIKSKYMGLIKQSYPLCSSYTIDIDNKKIHLWKAFKNNMIDSNFELPYKYVNITQFDIIDSNNVKDTELFNDFITDISNVTDINKNFGKKEAIHFYNKNINNQEYQVINCVVTCSSGTYIRGLARDISKDIGKHCIVYRINRINIF
jgi:tRNA pseudouridine(55) synthase